MMPNAPNHLPEQTEQVSTGSWKIFAIIAGIGKKLREWATSSAVPKDLKKYLTTEVIDDVVADYERATELAHTDPSYGTVEDFLTDGERLKAVLDMHHPGLVTNEMDRQNVVNFFLEKIHRDLLPVE